MSAELLERVRRLAVGGLSAEGDARLALEQIVAALDKSERTRASPPPKQGLSGDGVLRNIVSTIPYYVFWKDRESVYQGCNSAFGDIAGLDEPEKIVGCTDYDLPWKKEEADFFVGIDRRVMASGEAELNIVEPQKQADGRDRYIETSKVPLRNDDGEVVGILGIFTDITERKQLEQDLLAAKEAAEASDRAKGDFLAAVSHELRTPLTLILGPLESLLQDYALTLPAETLTTLRRVHRNACRLKVLTDDILDYSKGHAGLQVLASESLDVVEHARELIDDMQAAAKAAELALVFTTEAESLQAELDVRKFDKMLLNLVGNALKFTPQGGEVSVHLGATADSFEVSVADTGIGIDPAHHGKLFNRFVQVDASSTRKYGGTGLGLALVKQFSEVMGGGVKLVSELGHGARFTITLPIRAPAGTFAADSAQGADVLAGSDAQRRTRALTGEGDPAAIEPAAPVEQPSGERARLLIAEDNLDLRGYIESLFKDEYEIRCAGDGARALEEVRAFKPEVVLSDVMMPQMDGFQLVQRMREDEALKTIPVILLTARAGEEASASSLDSGADDFITKPFNPLDLRARVRAACRLNELNMELRDAQKHAAESERLAGLGRLLAKLSHEINNPMNVIANSSEVVAGYVASSLKYVAACVDLVPGGDAAPALVQLREELDWDFVKEDFALAVAQVCEAARRIKHIQTDFRFFLRGEHSLQLEWADLNEIVLGSIEQLNRSGRADITIVHDLETPDRVCLDAPKLGQALLNLLNNAADACGAGGRIVVQTRANDDTVQLMVTDDGPGISEAAMSNIFEPFFTTKDVGLGTGLGLAIVRELVERHKGELTAENVKPRGARFTISLPVSMPESARCLDQSASSADTSALVEGALA